MSVATSVPQVFEELLLDADWSVNAGSWMWLSCSSFFQQFFHCYCPVGFGRRTDPNGDFIRWVPFLTSPPPSVQALILAARMEPLLPPSLCEEHVAEVGGRVAVRGVRCSITFRSTLGVSGLRERVALIRERWRDEGGPHPGL